MGSQALLQVLRELPLPDDANLLVSSQACDDAVVYRVGPDQAIVASVDVFTPIVDAPYDYGQIAAANSLSDVYAMGARPLFALAIGGFPRGKMPLEALAAIYRGGIEKAREAGIAVPGGHTTESPEPLYGLAVVGVVHPARIVTNAGARPGDALILTKAIGTGLISTAAMANAAEETAMQAATESMKRLNRGAAEAMLRHGAWACTDVTGFGLLIHAHEMATASGCALQISASAVPLLPTALDICSRWIMPEGLFRNLEHAREFSSWDGVEDSRVYALNDPQTSGGLLIAVAEERADELLAALAAELGPESFARIGRAVVGDAGRVILDP